MLLLVVLVCVWIIDEMLFENYNELQTRSQLFNKLITVHKLTCGGVNGSVSNYTSFSQYIAPSAHHSGAADQKNLQQLVVTDE